MQSTFPITEPNPFIEQLNLFGLTVLPGGAIRFANAYTTRMLGWSADDLQRFNFFTYRQKQQLHQC